MARAEDDDVVVEFTVQLMEIHEDMPAERLVHGINGVIKLFDFEGQEQQIGTLSAYLFNISALNAHPCVQGPKVLGHWHVIYARDEEDYEAQRAGLIASGRAKPEDFCIEEQVAETDAARMLETFPITHTHEEWLDLLAQEERAR
ncbi:hypothetical protein [Microvirga sp. P5_D2]